MNKKALIRHQNKILDYISDKFSVISYNKPHMNMDFIPCGFNIEVKNELSKNISDITLEFDNRKYMVGFLFNQPFNPCSIWLSYRAKFNLKNSKKFVDFVYFFFKNYDKEQLFEYDVFGFDELKYFWLDVLQSKVSK